MNSDSATQAPSHPTQQILGILEYRQLFCCQPIGESYPQPDSPPASTRRPHHPPLTGYCDFTQCSNQVRICSPFFRIGVRVGFVASFQGVAVIAVSPEDEIRQPDWFSSRFCCFIFPSRSSISPRTPSPKCIWECVEHYVVTYSKQCGERNT